MQSNFIVRISDSKKTHNNCQHKAPRATLQQGPATQNSTQSTAETYQFISLGLVHLWLMTNCPHPMCMHMRLLILKSKQSSLVYTPLSLGSFALNTISSGRTLDHRSVLLCLLTSSLTNQRMYYLYSFIIKRDKELTIFILLSRQGVNTQNKLPTNQHIDCLVYFFIIKWGKKVDHLYTPLSSGSFSSGISQSMASPAAHSSCLDPYHVKKYRIDLRSPSRQRCISNYIRTPCAGVWVW